jgi:predicted ATPase
VRQDPSGRRTAVRDARDDPTKLALEGLAEESDADGVRRRHAEYFVDLATNAEDELRGLEQRRWLHRLELEHDKLPSRVEPVRTS